MTSRSNASVRGASARLAAGHYFGAIGGRLDTPLAVLSEVIHPAGRALPEHDHALDYFCMLLRGRYAETIAGRAFDYAPFQVGFHPAGIAHVDEVAAAGARFLCLEIRAPALREAAVRLDGAPALLPADITLHLLRLWQHLARQTLDAVVLDSATWEVCGATSGERPLPERGCPRWLVRCLALLEDAFDEPWTIDAVARAVGVHPVHLSREFRRRYGQTFGDYLQKVRVRAACARIVERDESLAQTAASVGFADQSHFCKVFKSRVGRTPSAFAALAATRH